MDNTLIVWTRYLRMFFAPLMFTLLVNFAYGEERNIIYSGKLKSDSYFTTLKGSWKIVREGKKTILKLEDNFKSSDGPDLKIFFSKLPFKDVDGDNAANKDVSVKVGVLKSFAGKNSFVIPDEISLDSYKSIIIHCEKYSKLWGGAVLKKKK